jgi:hypothetical protein
MARTLDKTRDFCEVWGGTGEARHFQDGAYFDADGEEIGGEETPKNKGGRPKKVEPEQPALDAELEAQINANLEG